MPAGSFHPHNPPSGAFFIILLVCASYVYNPTLSFATCLPPFVLSLPVCSKSPTIDLKFLTHFHRLVAQVNRTCAATGLQVLISASFFLFYPCLQTVHVPQPCFASVFTKVYDSYTAAAPWHVRAQSFPLTRQMAALYFPHVSNHLAY